MTILFDNTFQFHLKSLGLSDSAPLGVPADDLFEALDLLHSYLADSFAQLVDCKYDTAYQAIQRSPDISNGDFVVIIPRLVPKNADYKESARELARKVCRLHLPCC